MSQGARSTVEEAYLECERITRTEAGNFYYGIRLLPAPKRTALCAVYALARRVDDIGDGELPRETKLKALTELRADLEHLDEATDPVLVALADAARRYPVPLGAFGELIDGVETDLAEFVTIADWDELVVYCRRVAGAIGRLCLSIFGTEAGAGGSEPRAELFADQLGIALQQTNILRDVREDLGNRRIYLPQSELAQWGIELRTDAAGDLDDPEGRLAAYLRFAAARAEDWYGLGLRLVPHLDRRSAACCTAMAGIYRHLNQRIAADPVQVYDKRLRLSGAQKARVAVTCLLRGRS
ncbi:presqualene diphosphate synthase HpnD [Nocardioides sp. BP30]|uniref:presqualene diphosphate synthase HpnD n=1 Tax=Nocardioides sp. BP30 TaxID=3036374 RepID=UPI0024691E45|nr:presqualene diphosphate synthase HpnD [Nocardioides sp. BP30]WGL53023.1 presqualene diphosphate synthase HpnD [Nocardioides sp. BP30]